jgi:hypothetical protein
MRDSVRRAVLGLAALGLLGMGSLGGGGEPGLPVRDFRATLTDVDGTRTEVSRFTAAGDVSLEGDLGRGRLRVPFDNIARIDFEPREAARERVRAVVVLRAGEPVTLAVRSSTTFSGQTPGGTYQIRARDLKAVDFGH